MSTPIVTVSDLAVYLGLGSDVDSTRATLIIQLAHDKCEGIVNPVPDTAKGVELDVSARAYTNPTTETSNAAGPYGSVTTALGGLWLTKANIADLRRLSSTVTGAFSIDLTPTDAKAGNYWPQIPLDPSAPWANPPFYGDFDQIPFP